LAGDELRGDAVRVYGPIKAKSRLLAYRDLRVMHAAAAPLIMPAVEDMDALSASIAEVVGKYARILGREAACEMLMGLLEEFRGEKRIDYNREKVGYPEGADRIEGRDG
jgi:hypothetical protein